MRGGSFQPAAAFPPMYRKAERYGRAKKMRAGKTGTAGGNFSAGTDVLRDEREGRDPLMKSIRILAVMILALLLAAPAAGASAGETQGPDESADADPQPVPVWKFCHGLRDGLDTAVITGWTTDCEERAKPAMNRLPAAHGFIPLKRRAESIC